MSSYESENIHPKFSKQQIECLLKAMENEWNRWENIIAFNRSGFLYSRWDALHKTKKATYVPFQKLFRASHDCLDSASKYFSKTSGKMSVSGWEHRF